MRISDWSSDVCSSDLWATCQARCLAGHVMLARYRMAPGPAFMLATGRAVIVIQEDVPGMLQWQRPGTATDRKSVVEGKSVSVRVDLGGRRSIKTKNNQRI